MKPCLEIMRKIEDFLMGTLPPDEAQAVRWHLGRCASCKVVFRSARRVVREFAAAAQEAQPPRPVR